MYGLMEMSFYFFSTMIIWKLIVFTSKNKHDNILQYI